MSIENEFWRLAGDAEAAWKITDGTDELEPYLLEILEFAKNNNDSREKLAQCFVCLLNGDSWPIEILEFCMRELQWPSVKAATISKMRENTDIRILDGLNRVLAVYEDEWEDADLYRYYS